MKQVSIIVRVLPDNEVVDVNLPLEATSIDIIETLLDNGIGSRNDKDGNQIKYKLTKKGKGSDLRENESLENASTQDGDVLLMCPVFNSSDVGKIHFSIPGKLTLKKRAIAKVKLSRSLFDENTKDKDFIPSEVKVELIEVSDVMKCDLKEVSIRKLVEIVSINSAEQWFSDEEQISWRFDIFPFGIGVTTLILKVSIINRDQEIERIKDVFLFDKEVLIRDLNSPITYHHKKTEINVDDIIELTQFNKEKKKAGY